MNVLSMVCAMTESLMVLQDVRRRSCIAMELIKIILACHVTGLFYNGVPTQPAVESTRERPARLPKPCACIVLVLDSQSNQYFTVSVDDV